MCGIYPSYIKIGEEAGKVRRISLKVVIFGIICMNKQCFFVIFNRICEKLAIYIEIQIIAILRKMCSFTPPKQMY